MLFGYTREPLDDERFRRTVFNNIYNPSQPQSERKEFLLRVHYQAGQFGDPVAIGQLMGRLRDEERTRLIERKKASDGPLRQLSEAPEAQPAHQAPAPPARRTRTSASPCAARVPACLAHPATCPPPRLPTPPPARQVRMYYMAVPPFLYAQICSALRPAAAAAAARLSPQASRQASPKVSPLS